ncbi:unnamed protein product [Candida verbasci]|uniref:Hyphally-regulated cell wall protein N-terminal domain-containing protein n=1 Tax=Candida verbasci TaxID=1227364 RepID=A0A9W4TYN5_9ASCO|nr:unnamed protein product [Candida verbasci]
MWLILWLFLLRNSIGVDIFDSRIDRGETNLELGRFTIGNGAYWSIVDVPKFIIGGAVTVNPLSALYVTNTNKPLAFTFLGPFMSLTNYGLVNFDTRQVSDLCEISFAVDGLYNDGDLIFNVQGGNSSIAISTVHFENRGVIALHQEYLGAATFDMFVLRSFANNGSFCMNNVDYEHTSETEGNGCFVLQGNSKIHTIRSHAFGSQTIVFTGPNCVLKLAGVLNGEVVKVAGFGNGNVIYFSKALNGVFGSWSYSSSTGILSLKTNDLFSFNREVNIGPGYTDAYFKLIDYDEGTSNAIIYNAPVPAAANNGNHCLPCGEIVDPPGTEPVAYEENGNLVIIDEDENGNWYTSTETFKAAETSTLENGEVIKLYETVENGEIITKTEYGTVPIKTEFVTVFVNYLAGGYPITGTGIYKVDVDENGNYYTQTISFTEPSSTTYMTHSTITTSETESILQTYLVFVSTNNASSWVTESSAVQIQSTSTFAVLYTSYNYYTYQTITNTATVVAYVYNDKEYYYSTLDSKKLTPTSYTTVVETFDNLWQKTTETLYIKVDQNQYGWYTSTSTVSSKISMDYILDMLIEEEDGSSNLEQFRILVYANDNGEWFTSSAPVQPTSTAYLDWQFAPERTDTFSVGLVTVFTNSKGTWTTETQDVKITQISTGHTRIDFEDDFRDIIIHSYGLDNGLWLESTEFLPNPFPTTYITQEEDKAYQVVVTSNIENWWHTISSELEGTDISTLILSTIDPDVLNSISDEIKQSFASVSPQMSGINMISNLVASSTIDQTENVTITSDDLITGPPNTDKAEAEEEFLKVKEANERLDNTEELQQIEGRSEEFKGFANIGEEEEKATISNEQSASTINNSDRIEATGSGSSTISIINSSTFTSTYVSYNVYPYETVTKTATIVGYLLNNNEYSYSTLLPPTPTPTTYLTTGYTYDRLWNAYPQTLLVVVGSNSFGYATWTSTVTNPILMEYTMNVTTDDDQGLQTINQVKALVQINENGELHTILEPISTASISFDSETTASNLGSVTSKSEIGEIAEETEIAVQVSVDEKENEENNEANGSNDSDGFGEDQENDNNKSTQTNNLTETNEIAENTGEIEEFKEFENIDEEEEKATISNEQSASTINNSDRIEATGSGSSTISIINSSTFTSTYVSYNVYPYETVTKTATIVGYLLNNNEYSYSTLLPPTPTPTTYLTTGYTYDRLWNAYPQTLLVVVGSNSFGYATWTSTVTNPILMEYTMNVTTDDDQGLQTINQVKALVQINENGELHTILEPISTASISFDSETTASNLGSVTSKSEIGEIAEETEIAVQVSVDEKENEENNEANGSNDSDGFGEDQENDNNKSTQTNNLTETNEIAENTGEIEEFKEFENIDEEEEKATISNEQSASTINNSDRIEATGSGSSTISIINSSTFTSTYVSYNVYPYETVTKTATIVGYLLNNNEYSYSTLLPPTPTPTTYLTTGYTYDRLWNAYPQTLLVVVGSNSFGYATWTSTVTNPILMEYTMNVTTDDDQGLQTINQVKALVQINENGELHTILEPISTASISFDSETTASNLGSVTSKSEIGEIAEETEIAVQVSVDEKENEENNEANGSNDSDGFGEDQENDNNKSTQTNNLTETNEIAENTGEIEEFKEFENIDEEEEKATISNEQSASTINNSDRIEATGSGSSTISIINSSTFTSTYVSYNVYPYETVTKTATIVGYLLNNNEYSYSTLLPPTPTPTTYLTTGYTYDRLWNAYPQTLLVVVGSNSFGYATWTSTVTNPILMEYTMNVTTDDDQGLQTINQVKALVQINENGELHTILEPISTASISFDSETTASNLGSVTSKSEIGEIAEETEIAVQVSVDEKENEENNEANGSNDSDGFGEDQENDNNKSTQTNNLTETNEIAENTGEIEEFKEFENIDEEEEKATISNEQSASTINNSDRIEATGSGSSTISIINSSTFTSTYVSYNVYPYETVTKTATIVGYLLNNNEYSYSTLLPPTPTPTTYLTTGYTYDRLWNAYPQTLLVVVGSNSFGYATWTSTVTNPILMEYTMNVTTDDDQGLQTINQVKALVQINENGELHTILEPISTASISFDSETTASNLGSVTSKSEIGEIAEETEIAVQVSVDEKENEENNEANGSNDSDGFGEDQENDNNKSTQTNNLTETNEIAENTGEIEEFKEFENIDEEEEKATISNEQSASTINNSDRIEATGSGSSTISIINSSTFTSTYVSYNVYPYETVTKTATIVGYLLNNNEYSYSTLLPPTPTPTTYLTTGYTYDRLWNAYPQTLLVVVGSNSFGYATWTSTVTNPILMEYTMNVTTDDDQGLQTINQVKALVQINENGELHTILEPISTASISFDSETTASNLGSVTSKSEIGEIAEETEIAAQASVDENENKESNEANGSYDSDDIGDTEESKEIDGTKDIDDAEDTEEPEDFEDAKDIEVLEPKQTDDTNEEYKIGKTNDLDELKETELPDDSEQISESNETENSSVYIESTSSFTSIYVSYTEYPYETVTNTASGLAFIYNNGEISYSTFESIASTAEPTSYTTIIESYNKWWMKTSQTLLIEIDSNESGWYTLTSTISSPTSTEYTTAISSINEENEETIEQFRVAVKTNENGEWFTKSELIESLSTGNSLVLETENVNSILESENLDTDIKSTQSIGINSEDELNNIYGSSVTNIGEGEGDNTESGDFAHSSVEFNFGGKESDETSITDDKASMTGENSKATESQDFVDEEIDDIKLTSEKSIESVDSAKGDMAGNLVSESDDNIMISDTIKTISSIIGQVSTEAHIIYTSDDVKITESYQFESMTATSADTYEATTSIFTNEEDLSLSFIVTLLPGPISLVNVSSTFIHTSMLSTNYETKTIESAYTYHSNVSNTIQPIVSSVIETIIEEIETTEISTKTTIEKDYKNDFKSSQELISNGSKSDMETFQNLASSESTNALKSAQSQASSESNIENSHDLAPTEVYSILTTSYSSDSFAYTYENEYGSSIVITESTKIGTDYRSTVTFTIVAVTKNITEYYTTTISNYYSNSELNSLQTILESLSAGREDGKTRVITTSRYSSRFNQIAGVYVILLVSNSITAYETTATFEFISTNIVTITSDGIEKIVTELIGKNEFSETITITETEGINAVEATNVPLTYHPDESKSDNGSNLSNPTTVQSMDVVSLLNQQINTDGATKTIFTSIYTTSDGSNDVLTNLDIFHIITVEENTYTMTEFFSLLTTLEKSKGEFLKDVINSDKFLYEIVPDITIDGAFNEISGKPQDVTIFYHMAPSVIHVDPSQVEDKIIKPAVEGTKNALLAAKTSGKNS